MRPDGNPRKVTGIAIPALSAKLTEDYFFLPLAAGFFAAGFFVAFFFFAGAFFILFPS
jgi:hypothetical protein